MGWYGFLIISLSFPIYLPINSFLSLSKFGLKITLKIFPSTIPSLSFYISHLFWCLQFRRKKMLPLFSQSLMLIAILLFHLSSLSSLCLLSSFHRERGASPLLSRRKITCVSTHILLLIPTCSSTWLSEKWSIIMSYRVETYKMHTSLHFYLVAF